MNEKITEVFFEEAYDLLDQLESRLLELEESPQDEERISAVFRIMHTIKGSAGMFGFDVVASFTHEIETAYDLVRSGKLAVTKALITATLESRDLIRTMMAGELSADDEALKTKLITEFKKITNKESDNEPPPEVLSSSVREQLQAPSIPESTAESETTYRIRFKPSKDMLFYGARPLALLHELSQMGIATIIPYFDNVPTLSEIEPEKCYISWDIVLTTGKARNEIEDVFIFLDDASKVEIHVLDIEKMQSCKLGEILVERDLISRNDIDTFLSRQKRLGDILVEENIVSRAAVDSALAEQNHIKKVAQNKRTAEPENNSVRVSSEKLDQLIDLVGELVTFSARLGQLTGEMNNPTLSSVYEQGERLILSLRDTTMDMRMLPIGTIFSRYKRLVRDLSADLKKSIELEIEGAETEMDKTVIEKLNDPLVHLIRNAVDHGVEMPDVRTACGKNAEGHVKLSATHAGAFVLIEIRDDGAGLDAEKIRAKGIERGLITAQDDIADQDLYDLIFEPGFSTNSKVTAVSGRGVGMDVVRKNILSLGGSVSIDTKKGEGTAFILKLPLTLAIIDGMLVRVGDATYVIPLNSVVECIEFDGAAGEGDLCSCINVRGEYLPFINLRNYFDISGSDNQKQQVVIVNDQDSKIGLIVDTVIGNYQTVIKPLSRLYKTIDGFSGATILGDGSVAIILDVYKLSGVIRKTDVRNA